MAMVVRVDRSTSANKWAGNMPASIHREETGIFAHEVRSGAGRSRTNVEAAEKREERLATYIKRASKIRDLFTGKKAKDPDGTLF